MATPPPRRPARHCRSSRATHSTWAQAPAQPPRWSPQLGARPRHLGSATSPGRPDATPSVDPRVRARHSGATAPDRAEASAGDAARPPRADARHQLRLTLVAGSASRGSASPGTRAARSLRSIRTRGPHGGASGVTQPFLRYRFTFKYDRRGRCRAVRTGSAAVTMSFRVTLPRWAATVGTDHSTASWWAGELRETAAHERYHVRLWRNAVRQANRVVATSSCRTVGRRLNEVWQNAIAANCRYDSAEYGISMRACLRR